MDSNHNTSLLDKNTLDVCFQHKVGGMTAPDQTALDASVPRVTIVDIRLICPSVNLQKVTCPGGNLSCDPSFVWIIIVKRSSLTSPYNV